MSLWWAKREQLDATQLELIERLALRGDYLILGPPGSGKSNVLVRRAQFVRGQGMPNVLVLTFTRALTEFVKTGCFDAQGREIFPQTCVTTLESWIRSLYSKHQEDRPARYDGDTLIDWKRRLAAGAAGLRARGRLPRYDALFVDEGQDLVEEEVTLIREWSTSIFLVGDDRQKIFREAEGLAAVRRIINSAERTLPFHYRLAPDICRVADRILTPNGGVTLEATNHYSGPTPGTVNMSRGPQPREEQLGEAAAKLAEQVRVYADLIRQGDRLGVIVARRDDREVVLDYFEGDDALEGKAKIIRARNENDDDYDPEFDPAKPICILTLAGCKGLEFRAVHWLFAEELQHHHGPEDYYTAVTRAKTSLDVYYTDALPETLARAHAQTGVNLW